METLGYDRDLEGISILDFISKFTIKGSFILFLFLSWRKCINQGPLGFL